MVFVLHKETDNSGVNPDFRASPEHCWVLPPKPSKTKIQANLDLTKLWERKLELLVLSMQFHTDIERQNIYVITYIWILKYFKSNHFCHPKEKHPDDFQILLHIIIKLLIMCLGPRYPCNLSIPKTTYILLRYPKTTYIHLTQPSALWPELSCNVNVFIVAHTHCTTHYLFKM